MPWPWPGDRPSYVFSEDAIGFDQRVLLRNVYRTCYTPSTHHQIMDGSLLRAYAKPLLVSLVLYVLCTKLKELISLAPGVLGTTAREDLQSGVLAVRDQLAAAAEPSRLKFVRELVDQISRAITMFRDGHARVQMSSYNPITRNPIQNMVSDSNLPASGLREVAVATGILGMGINDGVWTLKTVDTELGGVVRIDSTGGPTNVYFVAHSQAALGLLRHGYSIDCEDAVVVHSLEVMTRLPRSPRRAPGRTGQIGQREVSISELLNEVTTSADLIQRFREEVAL